MILYVVVPRQIGVVVADLTQLGSREQYARELYEESVEDYVTLTRAGYEVINQYEHIATDGTLNDVFVMERAGNVTELEPVSPPKSEMVG